MCLPLFLITFIDVLDLLLDFWISASDTITLSTTDPFHKAGYVTYPDNFKGKFVDDLNSVPKMEVSFKIF